MSEQRKVVDMSNNTLDNFVVRLGHYQDHVRNTRSLFAQTTIQQHKYWGWHLLVDKDGFRTSEKRPAIQTLCAIFANIFKREIIEVLSTREIDGLTLVDHYGEDVPCFRNNIHSKEFEAILGDLGFDIVFNRSEDKPRIESARIIRRG